MRLDRLVLRNFCQHKELDWEFPSGIIAISGPNGSGKSNAIKAAYAALTGDFKRNDGIQMDNINKTCSEKDESYVELSFSVNGNVSTINRSLRPNKRSLIVNGGAPITSEREVAAAIEGLIGVNQDILNDYVFVDQWRMFEVFTAPKASRLVALQSLYGLGKAEICYDEISKIITKIRVPEVTESLEDIEHHIREKSLLLDSIKTSLSGIRAEDLDSTGLCSQLEVIKEIKRAKDSIASSTKEIDETNKKLDNLRRKLADNSPSKLLHPFKDEAELKSYTDSLVAVADTWTAIAIKENQINALTLDINNTRNSILEAGSGPDKPMHYVPVNELDRINEIVGEVLHSKKSLENLKDKNECPTCKSAGNVLKSAVKALEDSIYILGPVAEQLTSDYNLSRGYDSKLEAHASRIRELSAKINVQQPILDNLNSTKEAAPSMSKEAAMAEVASLKDLHKKYERCKLDMVETERDIAYYEGACTNLIQGRASEYDVIKKHGPVDETFDFEGLQAELVKAIDVIRVNNENKIRLEENLKATIDSIDFLEKRKARIVADKKEAKVNEEVRGHMEKLKEVMHKSNLPKKVAVSYLKQTVIKINGYLEDFNAQFRVYSDDELTFWARFSDGRDLPAARLSGGEKVVLALAFRLAVHFGVASNVSLLVLDEPTVGLDDDNIECLETAFNRLRAMSKASGLQVLVVSHEKAIERMCDHTLSLYR